MPVFIFRAVHRGSNGAIRSVLHEETIKAEDRAEAIAKARAIRVDLVALKANEVHLTDVYGRAIWRLHADTS